MLGSWRACGIPLKFRHLRADTEVEALHALGVLAQENTICR